MQDAYDRWADRYVEAFGSPHLADEEDRELIRAWAQGVDGRVLDAGCGPGHWSGFLHDLGLQVQGVDLTPSFIDHAARTRPDIPFRVGDLRRLDLPPASLGGVLAWFSLIHLEPEEAAGVLADLRAALRPGGTLLVGFFTGDDLRPFDHRVVRAWAWPVGAVREALRDAGLEVLDGHRRVQPNGRIVADLTARRPMEPAVRR